MGLVVKDGIAGRDPLRGIGSEFAGIEVAVKPGEIAAGDLEPHAMPGVKDVARGP